MGQANGEELHDLAGVILIGRGERGAGGIEGGLGVAEGTRILAHEGAEADLFEEGAVVAEGAVAEDVVVVGDGFGAVVVAEGDVGDDEDFG